MVITFTNTTTTERHSLASCQRLYNHAQPVEERLKDRLNTEKSMWTKDELAIHTDNVHRVIAQVQCIRHPFL